MEAKDLMIGDWVNIYVFPNENPQKEDLFPARISTIMTPLPSDDSGEHCECQFVSTDGGVGCASRPIETCLPIPLTPEILKENGFVYSELPFEQSWQQFGLSLYSGGDGYRVNCGNNVSAIIDSVHQLQHLLKLCGIYKEITL